MKIVIEFEPFEEIQDPDDATGLTEEAYEEITGKLMEMGDVVDVRKVLG